MPSSKSKNNKALWLLIFFIVIVILLFVTYVLYSDNNELQVKLFEQEAELSSLNNSLKEINDSYNLLYVNSISLESNLSTLENEYSGLLNEIESILYDVENYQKEIEISLAWYKTNSELDDSPRQINVKRRINTDCYEIKNGECRIKLGCFDLVNSEKLNLNYMYDSSTYGVEDKISSLSDFLDNKGGDCEDYALFFKAEYNYASSRCEGNEVVLSAWRLPEPGERVQNYWLNFYKTWYRDDVVEVVMSHHSFPNIICGTLYDPIADEISGHCMIAFSSKQVNSVSDLTFLDGAYVIEPQNGYYAGLINGDSEIYLLNEDIYFDETIDSYIFSVITNDDYYLFNEETLSWESYASFYSQLEQKKMALVNKLKD